MYLQVERNGEIIEQIYGALGRGPRIAQIVWGLSECSVVLLAVTGSDRSLGK